MIQYDDNPDTKYYLDLGCDYLAQNHAKKYETESVQEKQDDAYYRNCLHAVWPGSSFETLPSNECHLKDFDSFRKGDVLTHPDKQPPFVAREDGFVLSADYGLFLDTLLPQGQTSDEPGCAIKTAMAT